MKNNLLKSISTITLFSLVIFKSSYSYSSNSDLVYDCQKVNYKKIDYENQFSIYNLEKFDNATLLQKMGPLQIDSQLTQGKAITLADLYNSSARVSENITIGQHTYNVLEEFDEQWKFLEYRLQTTHNKSPQEVRELRNVLRLATVLHDIGKSIGPKNTDQHKYTIPIICSVAQRYNLKPDHLKLMTAIVGNDIFGDYVKPFGSGTTSSTVDQLEELSQFTKVPLREYFDIQKFLYTIDAHSYESLKDVFYKDPKNGLMIKDNQKIQFSDLIKAMKNRASRQQISSNSQSTSSQSYNSSFGNK